MSTCGQEFCTIIISSSLPVLTCNQVAIRSIIMRIAIWLVVVCLAIAVVEGAKKPKGKGKPSKGKGKPSKGSVTGSESGSGSGRGGEEEEICCCEAGEGSGEEGGPGGQEPEPRGFCIDHMTVGAICMAGSSVVEKMLPAMDACAEECNGFERSSGKV